MYKILIALVCILFWGIINCSTLYAQEDPKQAQGLAREYYREGLFYGKQGKYIEAIMALEKAIEISPAYADAYNALGVIYHRQKQNQEAIVHYLLAIEAEPSHAKARTNLAMIYNEQEAYQKAVHQLEKALQDHPEYEPAQGLIEPARENAAEQEMKEREQQQKVEQPPAEAPKAPKASKTPKTPVEQKPKSTQKTMKPLFHTGTQLMREGRLDAAIRSYRKELERLPRSAEGYSLLGMAYREKFRTTRDSQWRQQETAAFTTALKFQPTYIPALLALGEIYYERGEFDKAVSYFEKALAVQPKHPAREQLETIMQQIK